LQNQGRFDLAREHFVRAVETSLAAGDAARRADVPKGVWESCASIGERALAKAREIDEFDRVSKQARAAEEAKRAERARALEETRRAAELRAAEATERSKLPSAVDPTQRTLLPVRAPVFAAAQAPAQPVRGRGPSESHVPAAASASAPVRLFQAGRELTDSERAVLVRSSVICNRIIAPFVPSDGLSVNLTPLSN
jgi:hypothetical protein